MDEILLSNFMVFHDLVRDEQYDLWIGDEAWELDYYLHENPEQKRAPYVWLTDFGANAIVRFDPTTEAFTPFHLPDADAAVRQLNGRPGEVWGAESAADRLVVIRYRPE